MSLAPKTIPLPLVFEDVALFPLDGVALLPHALLPLHVFEPRYRALVAEVLAKDGWISIPQFAPGWESQYEDCPPLVPTCGVGRIVRHQAMPDGRSNIVILGVARGYISHEYPLEGPFRRARLIRRDEGPGSPGLSRHVHDLRQALLQLAMQRPDIRSELLKMADPQRVGEELADILAPLSLRLPVDRQRFLEEDDPAARAALVLGSVVSLLENTRAEATEA
jgi:Lon protease-like protein